MCLLLDKYKDRLDRSRRDRNQSSLPSNSSDGLISIHQSETSPHNQSESSEPIRNGTREHRRPRSSAAFQNETSKNPLPLSGTSSMGRYGQSSLQDHTPEAGYFEGPAEGLASERHPRPDLVSSSSKLKRNTKQNKTKIKKQFTLPCRSFFKVEYEKHFFL